MIIFWIDFQVKHVEILKNKSSIKQPSGFDRSYFVYHRQIISVLKPERDSHVDIINVMMKSAAFMSNRRKRDTDFFPKTFYLGKYSISPLEISDCRLNICFKAKHLRFNIRNRQNLWTFDRLMCGLISIHRLFVEAFPFLKVLFPITCSTRGFVMCSTE